MRKWEKRDIELELTKRNETKRKNLKLSTFLLPKELHRINIEKAIGSYTHGRVFAKFSCFLSHPSAMVLFSITHIVCSKLPR